MASSTSPPSNTAFSLRTVSLGLLGLFLLVYLLDFAWYEIRLHVPKLGAATGSVHRIRLLAIPNKGEKTTYELDQVHPEEDVPCSHSLLPEGGTRPCWYVTRHVNDPIPIGQ
jgi:hypothetical protein